MCLSASSAEVVVMWNLNTILSAYVVEPHFLCKVAETMFSAPKITQESCSNDDILL